MQYLVLVLLTVLWVRSMRCGDAAPAGMSVIHGTKIDISRNLDNGGWQFEVRCAQHYYACLSMTPHPTTCKAGM